MAIDMPMPDSPMALMPDAKRRAVTHDGGDELRVQNSPIPLQGTRSPTGRSEVLN